MWTELVLAVLGGVVLGTAYFGALWWTVRRAYLSRNPALVVMSSLFLRWIILGASIFFLAERHWFDAVAALLGLLVARRIWVWRVGSELKEIAR